MPPRLRRTNRYVDNDTFKQAQGLHEDIVRTEEQIAKLRVRQNNCYIENKHHVRGLSEQLTDLQGWHIAFVSLRAKREYSWENEPRLYSEGEVVYQQVKKQLPQFIACNNRLSFLREIFKENASDFSRLSSTSDSLTLSRLKVLKLFRQHLYDQLQDFPSEAKKVISKVVFDPDNPDIFFSQSSTLFQFHIDELSKLERSLNTRADVIVYRGTEAIARIGSLTQEIYLLKQNHMSNLKEIDGFLHIFNEQKNQLEKELSRHLKDIEAIACQELLAIVHIPTLHLMCLKYLEAKCKTPAELVMKSPPRWVAEIANHYFKLGTLPPASSEVVHTAEYQHILGQFALNLIRDPRYIKKETGAGSGGVFFLTLAGEKIFVLREGSIQAPPVLNEYASCYVSGRLIRYALFSGDDKDGNPVEGMITEVFPNVGSFHALLDLFRLKDIEIVPDDPDLQSSLRSFTEKFALCQRLGIEHDKTPMDMRLWNHINRKSFLDGLLFEVICVNTDLNYGNLLIQRKANEQIHVQFIDWEKCFPKSYPDDFIDFDISVKTDMGGTILQTPVPSKFKDLLKDQWINSKIAFLERNLKLSQEGIAVFKAHCLFVRTAATLRCNIDIVYSIFTDVLGEPPCNRVCSWHRQAFSQIDGDDEKKWLEFCRLCLNELSERMKQPTLLK